MNAVMEKIPPYVWPIAALALWILVAVTAGMLRFTPYGLDEGAARSLMLNWSTSAQMATPIFAQGAPDLRALLFIPLGVYWTGSMIAAKVYTLMMMFIGIFALWQWSRERFDDETALLASGLMLIAPLTLLQINQMGTGVFVLLMLALGRWVDRKYRSHTERSINSWYFVQILLVCICITLHPMGLAYASALAWTWFRNPLSIKHRNHVFIGLATGSAIILAMGLGWVQLDWFSNPIPSLAHMFYTFYPTEPMGEKGMVVGTLVLLALLAVLGLCWRQFSADFFGLSLIAALLLGLFCADSSWALIAQVFVIYGGVALIVRLNDKLPLQNFVGRRGVSMALLFALLFWFMQMDKAQVNHIANHILTPQDQLIEQLSLEAQDQDRFFLAASEWPARTMIAVKRDVFPLPPASKDSEQLWNNIKPLSHVIFSHSNPENHQLGQQLSALTDVTKTLIVDQGGVIVAIDRETAKEGADTKPEGATVTTPAAEKQPETGE